MGEVGLEPTMPKPRFYRPLQYQFCLLAHKQEVKDSNPKLAVLETVVLPLHQLPISSPNRTRTCDILINSQTLYQLSYKGIIGMKTSNFY